MRVLHAPANVGNQPWTVSRYERELGVSSDVIVNYSTWLGYPADRVLGAFGRRDVSTIARRLWAGITAPLRYDVLHYYFGRSLLTWDDYGPGAGFPFLDLKLGKRLGRKVFLTLQGCDVRLAGESNRRNVVTMCRPRDGCSLYATCRAATDARRRKFIEGIVPLADRALYLPPELGHYVPGATFMPYAVPVDRIEPAGAARRERPLVLHAPSDESIKGTRLIEAALDTLATQYAFDYVAIRGVPHDEAMKRYAEADLVIDQVLGGWYGAFAVEVMSMAKPVVCYLRDEDLHVLPRSMREELPVVRVDPRSLADDLARVLDDRRSWPDIGAASRRYALRWHHPRRIAAALVDAYNDARSRFDLEAHVDDRPGAAFLSTRPSG